MLGHEPCRGRGDEATVVQFGVEGEVLENDPRLRADDSKQSPGAGPQNHAVLDVADSAATRAVL